MSTRGRAQSRTALRASRLGCTPRKRAGLRRMKKSWRRSLSRGAFPARTVTLQHRAMAPWCILVFPASRMYPQTVPTLRTVRKHTRHRPGAPRTPLARPLSLPSFCYVTLTTRPHASKVDRSTQISLRARSSSLSLPLFSASHEQDPHPGLRALAFVRRDAQPRALRLLRPPVPP